jgi:hypothetical protein
LRAEQSNPALNWIASSLTLLAMTIKASQHLRGAMDRRGGLPYVGSIVRCVLAGGENSMGRSSRIGFTIAASALALMLPTAPAGAASYLDPLAAEVSAGVKIFHGFVFEEEDETSSAWGTLLSPLEAQSHLFRPNLGEGHTSVYASWADADSGRVQIFTDGRLLGASAIYNTAYPAKDYNWFYTFTGISDSKFEIDFSVENNGVFGAGGFRIFVNDAQLPGTSQAAQTYTGSVDFDVLAGETYTVRIENFSGYSGGSDLLYRNSGTFDFAVTALAGPGGSAVPEPATWTMLILGFGLVGWSLRAGTARNYAAA